MEFIIWKDCDKIFLQLEKFEEVAFLLIDKIQYLSWNIWRKNIWRKRESMDTASRSKFRGCSSDGCYWITLYKSETTDTLFSFDPVISEVYSADYLFSICPTWKFERYDSYPRKWMLVLVQGLREFLKCLWKKCRGSWNVYGRGRVWSGNDNVTTCKV